MVPPSLSRDAEIVAYSLFFTGRPAQLTFQRPHIIHPRTRAALDELTRAGLLITIDPAKLPRGAMGWEATAEMGRPMSDMKRPTKAESFPITTE